MTGRWTAGVRREVLPNGLTVLIKRDDSAPVVAVVTHVKAGFFDEPDHWVGISHVLEHMYFKGTQGRGVGAIARETRGAGGYLNASTSYDHTAYYVVLPASGLATALDIQSDALRHSVIDPGELARELQVIIQEAKRKRDSPSALTQETLHEVMFDRHRIRRWRIGHEAALARFTRSDVWGYYRSRYAPARTILSIVGDVVESDAMALARRYYADWSVEIPPVEAGPAEPARSGVRARTMRGDIQQAELAIGWRTVPPLDADAPALDLAAAILGAGRGSWLYRSLRERGLVTSVAAYHFTPTELGVFSVLADLEASRLGDAITRLAGEINRLALVGPSDEDLERARTLLLTHWVLGLESMDGRASALAAAEALEDIGLLDREYEALASLPGRAVRDAVARHLDPDKVTGVVYLPGESGIDLTVERLQQAFAVSATTPFAERHPAMPGSSPASRPVPAMCEAGVWQVALPGADLLVRPKPGVPTVTLGLYVSRTSEDPPAQAGIGALLARSALRGAGGLDGPELASAFERLGGSLSPGITVDWLGFASTVLAERLPEAAMLLDLVFRTPTLADADVQAERGLMIEEARQLTDDMFRFPFQLAFSAAFGDLGYGLPTGGLPETLERISPEDVRRWHGVSFRQTRPLIVAVGDVDAERTLATLSGVFGDLPELPREERLAPLAWAPAPDMRQRVVLRRKAQSALALVFAGPTRHEPLRHAAEIWAAVASGLGGRLFEALRDRRSLAYTVIGSAWLKGRAGALVTYIATAPEREAEAREAMLEELRRFGREGVTEDELARAQNFLSGQAVVSRQSGAALAAEIVEAWLIGEGLEDLLDPGSRYRAVTAEDVQRLARRYLDGPLMAQGVVRGAATSPGGASRPAHESVP